MDLNNAAGVMKQERPDLIKYMEVMMILIGMN